MYADLPRPTIFAHRGASLHAPENTLAAFRLAVEQAADAIELDAKLCRDGHVVVIHDPTLERTTNGSGPVNAHTLAAIKQLDAGSFFDSAYQGEQIPTLDEVFGEVGKRLYINVELTNYTNVNDDLPDRVAGLVKRHNLADWVMFSSFNPIALRKIHGLLPGAPLGLLALGGGAGWWARSLMGRLVVPYQALHPEANDATAGLVRRLHDQKLRLHAYTVNNPEQMRRLFDFGVDGIFTDDPVLARQVLTRPPAATV